MLREDLAAPRKQRHTARRVFERLAGEHGAQVSYSYVAKYVARRRAEIAAEDRGRDGGLAGFVPQVREPGAEAEVDFGDVTVELAGQLTRCFLFAFRLSCSGNGVHRVYASQAQEAFLEGHVTAFEVMGGYACVDHATAVSERQKWWRSPPWSADGLDAVPGPVCRSRGSGPGPSRRPSGG
jgi:transposase